MSQQMAECLISLIKDLWIILHFKSQPCKGALLSDACLYLYNNFCRHVYFYLVIFRNRYQP